MLRFALICRPLFLAVILIGIGHAAGAARAGESKTISTLRPQSDTQPYVAVMGQIGRPGVFELPSPLPQLAEFLDIAGGLTSNASGSVRVIRGGHSSQFFISPKLSLQLIPDDLVIVESMQFVAGRQNGNTSSANGWQHNAGTLSAAPASAVVQIGLVNLISRPVILDVPREQASLAQVLSLLHQPVADKGEITVIKPGSGVQTVTLEQAFETTLSTGMVLVFNPATVNSAVLPRLPNTIRPEAIGETPITNTSAESASSLPTVSKTGLKAQAEPARHLLPLVPQETFPDASQPSRPSSNAESVAAFPATPLAGTNETLTTAGRSADVSSELPDFQALPDMNEQSAEAEPATALARPMFSIPLLVMLTGIVACCLGLVLWSRFKHRRQPAATQPLPEPVTQHDNALEVLISGELPMVEEALQLPYKSEIFGRPLETSRYRTDAAQTLSGPHFVPQPGPPKSEPVVAAAQAQDPASAPADRKVRVDMRHPRSTASALDRALATFEGEQP